jgi:cephalosporin-C deacetylase-like acetyl esterase
VTRFIPLALLLLLAPAARADDKPDTKAGDEMIDKYLADRTRELSGRFLDGARTRDEWEKKLPRLRREYLDMLGLWPLPEKTPLHATVTGTIEHEGVVIEKLHYQSKPGLYVTANLYRPKNVKGKLPAILYVCGHSYKGRDGNKSAYQDHGLWFANNGYVCLTVDSLQLGEIPGIHHGTYGTPYRHFDTYGLKGKDVVENRWWWQALGYTPAGVECWNGIRGIDYLCGRPDVDPERIGVTGISGGGASTVWIAAADERVKVAVPVSGMSDLESYVSHKVINGHCDCMFLVNTYQWEWTTILALIAPRPLLFCNSDNDSIFPMDGNRRVIERLRQVYKMYDRPELVDDYVSKGGHAYRPDLRVAVYKWFNKHLKNETGPVKDAEFKPLEGKQLRVFPEEKDIPKDAINGTIDETFVKRAEVKLPEAGKFDEWKKEKIKELREKSFRAFPERIPVPTVADETAQAVSGITHSFETVEPGVKLDVRFNVRKKADARTGALIVLNPGDRDDDTPDWAEKIVKDRRAHILPPRGVDGFEDRTDFLGKWTTKSPPNYVERAHALLGRTVDTGRVWDVAATVRLLDKQADGKLAWTVIGRGQAGVIAAYAALFEPSIKEVVIIDPPTSHKDGPIFLNVLRVLDIPDALGLLAPNVKLTLVGAKDKAFDRTAQLYKLAGAADKFERK